MLYKPFFTFFCILLISCTTSVSNKYDVEFQDRHTLAFTGKGAAAGIMLDSVLGGAGIAIGIAIDEGIAKDIAEGIFTSNPEFNFIKVVKRALSMTNKGNSLRKNFPNRVTIIRYGFRTASGEHTSSLKDAVSPWVTLEFDCSGSVKVINYPEDIGIPIVAELQDIKVDGALAINQLSKAVHQLTEKWRMDGACSPHS